jgi:hypothetical protein
MSRFINILGYWVAGIVVLISLAVSSLVIMIGGVLLSFLGLVGKAILALTIIFQVIFRRDN